MMGMVELLAHQGGWDEILLIALPVLLALFGLRWAEKRARSAAEAKRAGQQADEDAEG